MARTGRPRNPIWPLVIEDYKTGTEVIALSEKYNLSVWGVKKALKREGIFVPKPVGAQKGQPAWNKKDAPVYLERKYILATSLF